MAILHFFLIVALVCLIALVLCFFLADRLTLYFSLANKKLTFAICLWIFIFICISGFGFVHTTNKIAIVFHWIGSIAWGFYLYLIIGAIFAELLRKLIRLNNKNAGIFTFLSAVFITAYGVYNSYQIVVTYRTVELPYLTEPIKAVHITDTHIGQFRNKKDLQKLVDMINEINPEVVFHTGDLLDSRVHLNSNVLAPLADIKVPIFFVHGNHDQDTGMLEIGHELRKLKVRYLQNRIEQWRGIQIVGLDYMQADENDYRVHSKRKNRATIQRIIVQLKIDQEKPVILMHHAPYGIAYAQAAGSHLYLAGHTHGGQIFPFNLIYNWVIKFNAGFYDYKGMKVNVPYGTGTYGPPMRVGTKSEFTVLNLVPKQ